MDFDRYVKDNALFVFKYDTIDIKELVSFLQNKTNITKLSLERAEIGAEGAKELAKLISLTSLSLINCNICAKGAKELAKLS